MDTETYHYGRTILWVGDGSIQRTGVTYCGIDSGLTAGSPGIRVTYKKYEVTCEDCKDDYALSLLADLP